MTPARKRPAPRGGPTRRRARLDPEAADLVIGGVHLRVSEGGVATRVAAEEEEVGPRGARARDDDDDDDAAAAAAQDYMDSIDVGDAATLFASATTGATVGRGPAPEDLTSADYDDDEADTRRAGSSGGGASDGWGTGGGALSDSDADDAATALAASSLVDRWPVPPSVRARGAPGAARKKKKKKPPTDAMDATPSAATLRMAPGDKTRARRARVDARRAARASARGFDLRAADAALAAFVSDVAAGRDADVCAFPPLPAAAASRVSKLAALYGLKAGMQGSGKKRVVVALPTQRTALPVGAAAARVADMLAWHDDAAALAGAPVAEVAARLRGVPAATVAAAAANERAAAAAAAASRVARRRGGAPPAPSTGGAAPSFVSAGTLADGSADVVTRLAPVGAGSGDDDRCPSPAPRSPPASPPPPAPPPPPPPPAWPPSDSAAAVAWPTAASERVARKKKEKLARRAARAAGGTPDAAAPPGAGFASFEAHSRGVGSRLLAKMGFGGPGAGLGARGQGRAEPLAAAARPRRAGLGAE